MNRRGFLCGFGSLGYWITRTDRSLELARLLPRIEAVPVEAGWPVAVAGITLPDSKIAKDATDLSRAACPPFLFNHCVRTYIWGALAGKAAGQRFDSELLYLACILHDLGLTDQYQGTAPFEIQGAEAARVFLEKNGLSKEAIEIVWDGIAMHCSPIGGYKRPEIALVGEGAGSDVLGPGSAQISADLELEIHKAFPRLGFKAAFVKSCADVVRKYPRAASAGFMRDVRERYLPEFHPTNFCERVAGAPFAE